MLAPRRSVSSVVSLMVLLGTINAGQLSRAQTAPSAPVQSQPQEKTSSSTQAEAPPQETTAKVQLEISESLFATLVAINACGYDQDLANSDPLRAQIRNEVAAAVAASAEATAARDQVCGFYAEKQQADAARDLAQYVSLAVYLKPPPDFTPTVRESDLPPDASNILGFIPALKAFYESADIHRIWMKHRLDYERRLARLHEPVSQMILRTDYYLKLPQSSYLGRKFVVYVEPLGAPGQVNARNYGADYYLVVTPGSNGALRMDQIRHTYLHYILDTLAQKRANAVKRLDPLLQLVKTAPMEESYKNDTALMLIESVIRAVEARTLPARPGTDAKQLEAARSAAADDSMKQGFVLTRYFYDALISFEQSPTGLKDSFGDMLYAISLDTEKKRIAAITFSSKAAPELLSASKTDRPQMLDLAEEKLAKGDAQAAHRIAQEVIDNHSEDPARAMFILARAATLSRDIDGAQSLFERTLEIAHEPRTVAWSHIYIGRILDLKCNRDSALSHYRAALKSGDSAQDVKAAADKGISELPPGCEKDR